MGRAEVKPLASGPTRNLAVGAGTALAAVSGTGAGPWDQLFTVPTAALGSILSARAPLRPRGPAFCGLQAGLSLTDLGPHEVDQRDPALAQCS